MEATFAFLDLAGFTALTETHGDEAAAALIQRFAGVVGNALANEGRLVSIVGDGAFLTAATPAEALRVVQRLFRLLQDERDFPMLRAGLHHGEAAERGGQFYGNAVNIAARIAGYARGGQVLCSETLVAAARAAGVPTQSLGPISLKNLREPLELFSLAIASADSTDPIDPVCRMRVARERAAAHLEVEGTEHWFCSRECLRVFLGDTSAADRSPTEPASPRR
jgi:class 3 adenylate cyclase/YHS domain-containing protein